MWGVEDKKYEQKHKNLELGIKQAGSKLTVDLAEHYHKQNFLLKFTTLAQKIAEKTIYTEKNPFGEQKCIAMIKKDKTVTEAILCVNHL